MRPPWITSDGLLDVSKYPLEPLIDQTLDDDDQLFRAGCTMLGSKASRGGRQARIYLVGLLAYYRDHPARREAVVSALSWFPHAMAANALTAELHRVESSNATRRYLGEVLDALTRLPRELWQTEVSAMAEDTRFSPRWRRKFDDALWSE
jgi:hypothetical protein